MCEHINITKQKVEYDIDGFRWTEYVYECDECDIEFEVKEK